jgi:hypothetical protein
VWEPIFYQDIFHIPGLDSLGLRQKIRLTHRSLDEEETARAQVPEIERMNPVRFLALSLHESLNLHVQICKRG